MVDIAPVQEVTLKRKIEPPSQTEVELSREEKLKKRLAEMDLQGGDDVKRTAEDLNKKLQQGEITPAEYASSKQFVIDATMRSGSTTPDIFSRVEAETVTSAEDFKRKAEDLVSKLSQDQITIDEYTSKKNNLLNTASQLGYNQGPSMIAAAESKNDAVMAKIYEPNPVKKELETVAKPPEPAPQPVAEPKAEPAPEQRVEQKSLPNEYREHFKKLLKAGNEELLVKISVDGEGKVTVDQTQLAIVKKIKEAFDRGDENVTFTPEEGQAAQEFLNRMNEMYTIAADKQKEREEFKKQLDNRQQTDDAQGTDMVMKAAFGGGKDPMEVAMNDALDVNTPISKKRELLLGQPNTSGDFTLRDVLLYQIKRNNLAITRTQGEERTKRINNRDVLTGTFLSLQTWSMEVDGQQINLDTPINDALLAKLGKK